jgi:hypothetical protein
VARGADRGILAEAVGGQESSAVVRSLVKRAADLDKHGGKGEEKLVLNDGKEKRKRGKK